MTPQHPEPDRRVEYLKQEIAAARAELAEAEKELSSVERATVVAIGAVYAWLATHNDVPLRGAWLIPSLFALFGGLRAYALSDKAAAARQYLIRVTSAQFGDDAGWDATYVRLAHPAIRNSIATVWLMLFLFTLGVGWRLLRAA